MASYPKRTKKNVTDSDGTLVISHGKPAGGPAVTVEMAKRHNRPLLHLDMARPAVEEAVQLLRSWIADRG